MDVAQQALAATFAACAARRVDAMTEPQRCESIGGTFALQGHGVTVAPELFQTLPYVATIVALVLVSSRAARLRFGAPAALGLPYAREER